jgi:asparagine synthase (glutamine-hydrolysing)
VRVPFCDHRLVEYVFGTPWAHKNFDGREKSLLRAATADVLPQSVVQRVKSPYPSTQDPDYDRMLHAEFAALVSNRDSALAPLLDTDGAESARDTPEATNGGAIGGRMVLERILALEAFLTNYGVSVSV